MDMLKFVFRWHFQLRISVFFNADFGTDVVRNTSNILNAYNAGRLSALPRLSDHFIDLKEEE